ncbi:MAG: response regulator HsfA, partial [Labilithrix sp.]|nr:response regulator HsfA [Labilithrix sp.]
MPLRRTRLRWVERDLLATPAIHEVVVDGTRTIGSGAQADIRIRASGVATLHAEVTTTSAGVWARSLDGAPTALDDAPFEESRELSHGSTLRLGTIDVTVLQEDVASTGAFGPMVGHSEPMRELFSRMESLSFGSDCVLIEGEDGSGRLMAARALHEHMRTGHPLVIVDCRRPPPDLMEAAVFGLARSAPYSPGSSELVWNRPGPFEAAAAGTLVLLEVAAIPRVIQAKLARTIASRRARRIGEARTVPVAARIVATTHHDLAALTDAGLFAPELFEVLVAGGRLRVPPLRERPDDVAPLLQRFLRSNRTPAAVVARLERCRWQGNVGALANVARAMTLDGSDSASPVTERELLEAIVTDPDDDGPRLVYGDLLLARGDARGELVQVQCRLANGALDATERRDLEAVEETILAAVGPLLTDPVLALTRDLERASVAIVVRRGFVDAVRAPAEVLRRLDLLFRAAPALTELELDHGDRTLASPAEELTSPLLTNLRRLRMNVTDLGDAGARAIASCPWLASLRELVLAN